MVISHSLISFYSKKILPDLTVHDNCKSIDANTTFFQIYIEAEWRSFDKLGLTKVYNMFSWFYVWGSSPGLVTIMLSRGQRHHVMPDTHKLCTYTSQAYANKGIMSTHHATNIPLLTIKRWWSKVFNRSREFMCVRHQQIFQDFHIF